MKVKKSKKYNRTKIFLLGKYFPGEILSGPEKVAKRLFNELNKNGPQVIFIEYFFEGTKYNYLKKLFGKIIEGESIIRLGIFRYIVLLIQSRPEIVHIITFERFPLITYLLKIFLGTKIFYSVHGIVKFEISISGTRRKKFYILKDRIAEYVFFKFSDRLLFLSSSSLEMVSKLYKINSSKAKIISNGIDDCFHKVFFKRENTTFNKIRFVFVGDSNRKEKGFEFLQSVLNKMDEEFELYVIGSGYPELNNTKKSFYFFDKMSAEKLAEFYIDKHIFISASYYEPFSIAVVEAMAAGLVPVVTNETGVSRLINHGVNGFKFKYDDTKSLNEILCFLINNKDTINKVSSESSKIYDELCWERIRILYEQIYSEVLI